MKRKAILLIAVLCLLELSGCEKTEQNIEIPESKPSQVTTVTTEKDETSENIPDQTTTETTDNSVDEVLDSFISGEIGAHVAADSDSVYYVTDLSMDPDEWDSYSIGEKVDLDNDGENELIICGPYGGMYLDARNNEVYEFAAGDGTAVRLSYVVYNGEVWILYSNSMNVGYEAYHMEKYEGADNLAAKINFSEELLDENNPEGGSKYILNDSEISYEKYSEFCSKVFATEVTTYSN